MMIEIESKPSAKFIERLADFVSSEGVRKLFAVMIPVYLFNIVATWHDGKWYWLGVNVFGLLTALLIIVSPKEQAE